MLNEDGATAKKLTLISIITQSILTIIAYSFGLTRAGISLGDLIFISVFAMAEVVLFLLGYFLVYRKLKVERVRAASTPSLILGIIQLFVGPIFAEFLFMGVIFALIEFVPGILLIYAYTKIRDSLEKNATPSIPVSGT